MASSSETKPSPVPGMGRFPIWKTHTNCKNCRRDRQHARTNRRFSQFHVVLWHHQAKPSPLLFREWVVFRSGKPTPTAKIAGAIGSTLAQTEDFLNSTWCYGIIKRNQALSCSGNGSFSDLENPHQLQKLQAR